MRYLAIPCMLSLAFLAGCGLAVPGMGARSAPKPESVMSNQFAGDVGGAKAGDYVTYVNEAGGSKVTTTYKVDGVDAEGAWVEQWTDMGSSANGYLFQIKDKKIVKAYYANKDDKEWSPIKVTEPPAPAAASGEKPEMKVTESDEKKTVKAGEFAAHKIETTMKIQGKDYTSDAWYSKDVPKLYMGGDQGGIVAMSSSGSTMTLDAKGSDGKPTIPLPPKG